MSAPDGAVFIGRCQPPHAAHVQSVLAALDAAPLALVLLGSANLARSVRNPLSAPERARLLRGAVREAGGDVRRLNFRPIPDHFDGARWSADVRAVAGGVFGAAARIALVGHHKDESGAYLRWFPGWTRRPLPGVPGLDATSIRRAWLTGATLPQGVPVRVAKWLDAFAALPAYARLRDEWLAVELANAALPPGIRLDEERWLHVQRGQVWVHIRQGAIGQGLWELPGHVLPAGTCAAGQGIIFDHPGRALVGQAIAHVFQGTLPPGVVGHPVPLRTALARPRRFHEDHHVILTRRLEAGWPDTPTSSVRSVHP